MYDSSVVVSSAYPYLCTGKPWTARAKKGGPLTLWMLVFPRQGSRSRAQPGSCRCE